MLTKHDQNAPPCGAHPCLVGIEPYQAVGARMNGDSELSEHERKIATLEWMPRSVRDRMDRGGIRISLRDWQALPMCARREFHRQAAASDVSDECYARDLLLAVARLR